MKKMDILIIAVFSIWISTGCAGKKIANTGILDQEARNMATNSKLSPDEAILDAASMLNRANTENLSFFAPLHLKEARNVLTKAQKMLKSGAKQGAVLEKAFKVKTLINDGIKTKKMVETTLAKVLEQKKILDDLDVQAEFPEKYEKSVSKIRDLVLEVEAGNFSSAVEGQSKVLISMSEVEIETMKKRYLGSAEAMMDKAKDIDADDYAEVTYEKARKQFETSTHFIERNYRDRKTVKKAGEEALLAAKHAFYVAKEAKLLVKIAEEEAEQRVLYFESLLDRIGQASGNDDITGLSLYDQAETLAKHIQDISRAQVAVTTVPDEKPVVVNSPVVPEVKVDAAAIVEKSEPVENIKPVSEGKSVKTEEAVTTAGTPEVGQEVRIKNKPLYEESEKGVNKDPKAEERVTLSNNIEMGGVGK